MKKIVVPQLNANDDSCFLEKYFFKSKEKINNGDILVTLNTSKASIDMESDQDGYFHIIKQEGTEVKMGEVIAILFDSVEELERYLDEELNSNAVQVNTQFKLTKQAEEFTKDYEFTEEEIASLNKRVIKLSDLEALLKRRKNNNINKLSFSSNQKMVAKNVSISHLKIPRAFLSMKVNCNKALEEMRRLSDEFGTIIGFGEVLTVIMADISKEFPFFYGTVKDENTFILAQEVNIGVTMDSGNGLFVPVVKNAYVKSLESVANVMFEYKMKLIRNSFTESDLSEGSISISLNTEQDVLTVLPIVFPDQVAMVSVGSVMKELVYNQQKEIVENNYFNLGISYDHRVVNGFQVMEYMKVIKDRIEKFNFKIYDN